MTFEELIALAQQKTPKDFDYHWLGTFVRNLPFHELNWENKLPPLESEREYARNILTLDPFEIVLLHWPAGVESAVHLHEGFWGYVLCLEGVVENVAYAWDEARLSESSLVKAYPGGILPEPDGTIHKIRNGSSTDRLVTLHFYFPALDNLSGLKLYDLAQGSIMTLNDLAPSASLELPQNNYKTVAHKAFTFDSGDVHSSHELVPILPKPGESEITKLIQQYYNEQATVYDTQDELNRNRNAYTLGVNQLIADGLRSLNAETPVHQMLHVACGTGRRALEIAKSSGLTYEIHGLDMSVEMTEIARNRGLQVTCGHVLEDEPPAGPSSYDAIAFLYAYGHLSSAEARRSTLERLHHWLKPGGVLFFDAFDIDNPNEWGAQAKSLHMDFQLDTQGYERGDVFYRRRGGEALAFLHYSNESALVTLLEAVGFDVVRMERVGYAISPGELVKEGGNWFMQVRKRTI